ncbi:MAG: hypothetical protein ACYSW3_29380 [Planctomycetota bacterium]|jgi:hypothetical protein
MNATVVKALIDLLAAIGPVIIFFLGLLAGYWMGRNSAERPFIQTTVAPKVTNQGSSDEPLEGDPFREAMQEDKEKAVPTIMDRLRP